MSSIIITGGTGNAGSGILTTTLASPRISHVTLLSRRPSYITHPKLSTILLPSAEYPKGFDECPEELVEALRGHTAVIWALGISQTQVNKEEYIKITHDYTMTFARAFKSLGTSSEPFRFIYISGEGADQTERARALYSKIKGRTEKALNAAQTHELKTVSLRPGAIIPMAEHRPHMNFLFGQTLRFVGGLFDVVYPSMAITSQKLGVAAVELAAGTRGWEKRTEEGWVSNSVLRQMVAVYGAE